MPFEKILTAIQNHATERDVTGDWPAADLEMLAESGAMRWALPHPFGSNLPPMELHGRYEAIAAASLAVALILTQRDSAVALIEQSEEFPRRQELLKKLSDNQIWATIGIAQLTTSRQGGLPSLRATPDGDGYSIDGLIPWSTGAGKSDYIVAGATLPDRKQILFCLPTNLPGVLIHPPLEMVALRATWTTQVHCRHVKLDRSHILRGPIDRVLSGRKKNLPLGQAFLALGLCDGALRLIGEHKSDAADRARTAFVEELERLRSRVAFLCSPAGAKEVDTAAADTRADVNDLAIRSTHAAVALYKGTALLNDHPAQRLAREAMFLLVWSCPGPVIDCTLDRLMEC